MSKKGKRETKNKRVSSVDYTHGQQQHCRLMDLMKGNQHDLSMKLVVLQMQWRESDGSSSHSEDSHFTVCQSNIYLLLLYTSASSSAVPVPGTFSWPLTTRGKPRRGMLRRAVFSDLQRKALERTFQKQKYISKPDRKKLASKLGLKDSQVFRFYSQTFYIFSIFL